MKRNKIGSLLGVLILFSAAVVMTNCHNPMGNQGNQGSGTVTGLEGVTWEFKKVGETTFPILEHGGQIRQYIYFDGGIVIFAVKRNDTLYKMGEEPYTVSGNQQPRRERRGMLFS